MLQLILVLDSVTVVRGPKVSMTLSLPPPRPHLPTSHDVGAVERGERTGAIAQGADTRGSAVALGGTTLNYTCGVMELQPTYVGKRLANIPSTRTFKMASVFQIQVYIKDLEGSEINVCVSLSSFPLCFLLFLCLPSFPIFFLTR